MGDRLVEIEQRFVSHIVRYSTPGTTEQCWKNYRETGDCGCNAEADMQGLIDEVKRLRKGINDINEVAGAVCPEFEICTHPLCDASCGAKLIALEVMAHLDQRT